MLEVRNIRKAFGTVEALRGVSLEIGSGEVRALLGSNGAGKSTLIRIVSGALRADSGQVMIDGEVVKFASTAEAVEAGVATVYQELSLVPGLSVAENIMLGHWSRRRHVGIPMIDRRAIRERATEVLSQLGLSERFDVDLPVHRFSLGAQQLIEIAKAISTNPRLLVFDEPTSALSSEDAATVIRLVRRLAEAGLSVVYVSHRMDEIPHVADLLTVMRDGRVVETLPVAEAPTERVAQLMAGDAWTVDRRLGELPPPSEEVALKVTGLARGGAFSGISFDLRRGEVLGIAGLMGSGRTELLRCIFGRDRLDAGSIFVNGRRIGRMSERRMISAGVGLAPEERRDQGLVLGLGVGTNLAMAATRRFVRFGIVNARRERVIGRTAAAELGIKSGSLDAPVASLSGGNQQKVVIGKWLTAEMQILLLDEPTRGIDVNAKEQIFQLIRRLARDGRSLIVVSSDTEDLFQICHRIAVLNHGHLVEILRPEETNVNRVLALAMKAA